MTDKEIIEVVKAHSLGRKIEFINKNPGYIYEWIETECPAWDFANYDYRIKPICFKKTTIQHFLDMGLGCIGKKFYLIASVGTIAEEYPQEISFVGKGSIITAYTHDEFFALDKIAIME